MAHKRVEVLSHQCVLRGPQTRRQSQRWPTSGQKCYIIPAFSGSPNNRPKSKVAHKWAEVLHHPCVLRGPQTRGKGQRWPTSGQKCYIIPALSGVPKQRDKVKGGPQVGGSATLPLRSQGSPNKGTKSKVAHKCAEVLLPFLAPKRGQKCYVPNAKRGEQNDNWLPQPCLLEGPKKGGNATSPLHPRGSPKKGNKLRNGCLTAVFSGARKSAEMLCHSCILGDPQRQARGAKSEVVPNKGEQNQKWLPYPCLLWGPKEGMGRHSCIHGGSQRQARAAK